MLTCEAESLTKPKIHDYETPSDMFSVHEIPNSQQCVKIESLEIMKRGGGFGCGREAQRGLAMLTNHILELKPLLSERCLQLVSTLRYLIPTELELFHLHHRQRIIMIRNLIHEHNAVNTHDHTSLAT